MAALIISSGAGLPAGAEHEVAADDSMDSCDDDYVSKSLKETISRAEEEARLAEKSKSYTTSAHGTRHFDTTVPAFQPRTADIYFRQARALAATFGLGDKRNSIALLLLNPAPAIRKLRAEGHAWWTIGTLCTHVSRVLGVAKQCPAVARTVGEGNIEMWRSYLRELAAQESSSEVRKAKADKILSGWVSIKKDVMAAFEKLEADPAKRCSQSTLLLGMLALMKPLRGGDAGTTQVKCGSPSDNKIVDDCGGAINCLILHTPSLDVEAAGAHLSLARYKVARSHGLTLIPVPLRLTRLIQKSLREQPRQYLFVGRSGEPRSRERHSYWSTYTLRSVLGKNLTVTTLRHVSATEIDFNEVDIADFEAHAREMCTSATMLFRHYREAGAGKRMREEKAHDLAAA